jgi:hypothetical protein
MDAAKEEAKKVVEMILLGHPGCGMMVVDIASFVHADYPPERRLRLYKLIYEMALEGRLWIGFDIDVHSFYAILSPTRIYELLDPLRRYACFPEKEPITLNEKGVGRRKRFEDFHQQIIELEEKVKKDKEEV